MRAAVASLWLPAFAVSLAVTFGWGPIPVTAAGLVGLAVSGWATARLVRAGNGTVWSFRRATRTAHDVEYPPSVWDRYGSAWDRNPDRVTYRLREDNAAGLLQDWPLPSVAREFGPITTIDPAEAGKETDPS